MELLEGGGAPVWEAVADGEALPEDGAEVGREREVEGGLDGGEFEVSEAVEDRDVGGLEVVDEGLGVRCE